MLIVYNTPLIVITAPELSSFITNINSYLSVDVTTNLNCSVNSITQNYNIVDILDSTNSKFYINTSLNTLFLKLAMLEGATIVDGIYKVTVKFNPIAGGYTKIVNCIFIDVTFKCRVASLIDGIISNNKSSNEDTSTMAHLLHYALFNSNNCGCNCEEMCTVFNQLKSILDASTQQIDNNCGCQ